MTKEQISQFEQSMDYYSGEGYNYDLALEYTAGDMNMPLSKLLREIERLGLSE